MIQENGTGFLNPKVEDEQIDQQTFYTEEQTHLQPTQSPIYPITSIRLLATEQTGMNQNRSCLGRISSAETVQGASEEDTAAHGTDFDLMDNSEPCAYLEGLNSDNLMQFSQQSQIDDLISRETSKSKQRLDMLPALEEHDNGGVNFDLNLNAQRKGKINWYYSDKVKKLYIKLNEIFNIEAVYSPKLPNERLRIRAMMVFVKEVSEPVLRCQNHISKDTSSQENIRKSILRCENSNVMYLGTAKGKNINDRLSILIPLSNCVKPNEDNITKQTIALKFTCQNSCIGRRETSVIFYLENMNCEVLSQRVIDIKICSCPKRDKALDEKNAVYPRKRSDGGGECPVINKRMKTEIKTESRRRDDDEDNGGSSQSFSDILPTPNGGYRVVFDFPNKEAAVHTIECGFNKITGQIAIDPSNAERYSKSCRKLKKILDRAQRLPDRK